MDRGHEGAAERIEEEVGGWPGIEVSEGRFGSTTFKLGKREIGHIHGDHALHVGFPKALWRELMDAGRITYHPVFPDQPGWAARRIAGEEDVTDAIALLRINYDRIVAAHGLPAGATA